MDLNLPPNVSSRTLQVSDLYMHILESNPTNSNKLVLLLHGFPELAYSWRKVIPALAQADYHVVAPDQRGYGRTLGDAKVAYSDDLQPYRMLNLVKDIVALVFALGYEQVYAVVGHDFGSAVAGGCALIRPDLFRRVVMMSAPFTGVPPLPNPKKPSQPAVSPLTSKLNTLDPPRKHYMIYLSGPDANKDIMTSEGGLHTFLRAYFHTKSADWTEKTNPHKLPSASPEHLSVMPKYYIMNAHESMPQSVLPHAPSSSQIADNTWLPDKELSLYASEFSRTGFQGAMNWYRCMTSPTYVLELQVFDGMKIRVPAMFISGEKDWGTWQNPGAMEKMKDVVCAEGMMKNEDVVLVPGAGHWVQQEQPEKVVKELLRFLGR